MIAAGAIVRAMRSRQREDELDRLSKLSVAERHEVVEALARLQPDARVDVGRLADQFRRHAAERAARQPAANPFGYALELMSLDDLHRLRDEIARTGDVAEAMGSVRARHWPATPATSEKRAHDLPTGAGDRPRRGLKRSLRAVRAQTAVVQTLDDKLDAIEGIPTKPDRAGRFIAGRAFDDTGPLGGADDAQPFPPPWLLGALEPQKETTRADVA